MLPWLCVRLAGFPGRMLSSRHSLVSALTLLASYLTAPVSVRQSFIVRLFTSPVHFSSPGGLVPRAGKKGECWTFLDWRLNSENDSPVHGQPSSRLLGLVSPSVLALRLSPSLITIPGVRRI